MKYLVTGLGNIGEEYNNTRHNIGFSVLDEISSPTSFELSRHALLGSYKHRSNTYILIKPTTYVNLSGKAVLYWLQKEKIPIENLLVVVDDISLPFGTLRLREKGGDGGHNGLNSIIASLGSNQFARLRFGIGNDFHPGQQSHFVLSPFNEEEQKLLPERILQAVEIIKSFGFKGLHQTMTFFNNK